MTRLLWTIKKHSGPVARLAHAMTFDERRRRIVMFGGAADGLVQLGDTWEWDGESWTQVNDIGPAARFYHAMAYDSRRGVVVLFGGFADDSHFADTWEWDGLDWTQVAELGPGARRGHTLVFGGSEDGVVLFGGEDDSRQVLGDTWRWNGEEWVQLADTGPPARWHHAMSLDSQRNRIVLFGGEAGTGEFGDTWEWDGRQWTQVSNFGPAAASGASLVYDGSSCILYGGVAYLSQSAVFRMTWQRNGGHWTARQNMGPGPRWGHAMAFDTVRKRGVLYGGTTTPVGSTPVLLADTWEQFELRSTPEQPPAPPPDEPPDDLPGSRPAVLISLEVIPPSPVEGERFQIVAIVSPPAAGDLEFMELKLPIPGFSEPLRKVIAIDADTGVFPYALFPGVYSAEASLNGGTVAVNFTVLMNPSLQVRSLTTSKPSESEIGPVVNLLARLNGPTTTPLDLPVVVRGPDGDSLDFLRVETGRSEAEGHIPLQSAGRYAFEARLGGATAAAVVDWHPDQLIASFAVIPQMPIEGELFEMAVTLMTPALTAMQIPFKLQYSEDINAFGSVIEIPAGADRGVFAFPHPLYAGAFSIEASVGDATVVENFDVLQNPSFQVTSLLLSSGQSDVGRIGEVTAPLNAVTPQGLGVPYLVWSPDGNYLDHAWAEAGSSEAFGWIPMPSPGEYVLEARLGGARAAVQVIAPVVSVIAHEGHLPPSGE